jgi:UDP-glucose 4-epimerase
MIPTILVTGGAGFIGGCFVRQLIAAQSTRVINLDKLTYAGNLDSLATVMENPLHVFIQGDIGDYTLVRHLLDAYQPMAIVNFAAESHVDRSILSVSSVTEDNSASRLPMLYSLNPQDWLRHSLLVVTLSAKITLPSFWATIFSMAKACKSSLIERGPVPRGNTLCLGRERP